MDLLSDGNYRRVVADRRRRRRRHARITGKLPDAATGGDAMLEKDASDGVAWDYIARAETILHTQSRHIQASVVEGWRDTGDVRHSSE